ncbi:MAG: alanine--tRNA ligase [Rhodobacterales bacterium]|nr:alanine--tRNA ligase [Rhodobacterales bacterium]
MRAKKIRKEFLSFFEEKKHTVVPSGSLIPHNDPTLFFVNAGMVPFKDVFTGAETRDYTRAASVQKCLRVSGKHNDLDNVGRTARHHTFFEMLGNVSFGDYFKEQSIAHAWEFLTNRIGVDADRLWVTVYKDDAEAYAIWRDKVGVREDRIQRLGEKDNFWSMGEFGPCGPSSEIFYDHGSAVSDCLLGPAGENDRYVELWNLVFMQFDRRPDGQFNLPKPSIDTGSGLERIAAALQGVVSNYDTDLFQPLIATAAELAQADYGKDDDIDTALRVISDHSRAAAFLIADGVMPSNEGRGYVLRRVMRRGIRFGVKIGIDNGVFHHTCNRVVSEFGEAYPELTQRQSFIEEIVRAEEERFRRTLDRGMRLLDTELDRAGSGGTMPGKVAFTLSDTYGFPFDLTQQIAEERQVMVDEDGFKVALEAQKDLGRAAWKGSGAVAVGALWSKLAEELGATEFTGYDHVDGKGTVVALVHQVKGDNGELQSERVQRLAAGDRGIVVLDRTAFYGESGGQMGDTGMLGEHTVLETSVANGLRLHHVETAGPLGVGDSVETLVDAARRDSTRRNHTATHLLHSALRNILGDHVSQKGSLVGPNRLRFDFAHHKSMTAQNLRQVEDQVNAEIRRNQVVNTELKSLDDAVADGAMALFGEKYDADVRVVSVAGYSTELCGGTHVVATGDIGLIRITSEAGIAAGVRRIEAQTGAGALVAVQQTADSLQQAAVKLKTQPEKVVESIERLQAERRELEKTIAGLKAAAAKQAAGALVDSAKEINGVKVLVGRFDGDLKAQADRLRDQLGSSIVILAADRGDKVMLIAAATKDIAPKRVHAGKVIQAIAPLVDGRGGGRPDMAQAGGTNPVGIEQALAQAWVVVSEQLGA